MDYYPGMEDLRRFYNSCLEYHKNKPIIFMIDRCVIPVGIVLAFGLFILGMILQMTMHTWDSSLCKIGMLCGFAMFPAKYFSMKRVKTVKEEESTIDFRSLERYKTEHKSGGFTNGHRASYCLHGNSPQQYQNEKNEKDQTYFIPIMIIGIFAVMIITYLLTKNNPEGSDRAIKIVVGICFSFVALVLGAGTLLRPLLKKIQYGRKVNAVCVALHKTHDYIGDSSSVRPVYMAMVDGKDYIYFHQIYGNVEEKSVGDVFPIYVNKKNPYEFTGSQTSGNVLFGMVFLLSFGVIGGVMLSLGILNM